MIKHVLFNRILKLKLSIHSPKHSIYFIVPISSWIYVPVPILLYFLWVIPVIWFQLLFYPRLTVKGQNYGILCWASQDPVQHSNPVGYKQSHSSFTACEYLEWALCETLSSEALWTLLFMNGEQRRQEISQIIQTLKVNRHVFPIPLKCQGQ